MNGKGKRFYGAARARAGAVERLDHRTATVNGLRGRKILTLGEGFNTQVITLGV
jgi:hypothetical protein